MLVPVCNVSVVLCGAWSAWGNGLLVVKIRVHLETGCQVHHRALLAEQPFVCLMCAYCPRGLVIGNLNETLRIKKCQCNGNLVTEHILANLVNHSVNFNLHQGCINM